MAALNRPVKATYEVHESVKVDTSDNEDHTFSGIMFPIKAKQVLPLESIVIHSVSVRGMLGKMSVWVTNQNESPNANGEYRIRLTARHWTKVYEKEHEASPRKYSVMKFDEPVVLAPGQIRALYIHSTLEGDEAIVYDNSRGLGIHNRPQPHARYEDAMITILSGKAHLSNQPFGQVPVWGWGNAWRDHREFVGQLEYGAVYKLWQPDLNARYGDKFRKSAMRLLACQRKASETVPALPDECVYYILNMCRWDWFNDSTAEMVARRRVLRGRLRRLELQRREQERLEREREAAARASTKTAGKAGADQPASSPRGCCFAAAAAASIPHEPQRTSTESTKESKGSESDDAAAQVADLGVGDDDASVDDAAVSSDGNYNDADDESEDDDEDGDEEEAHGGSDDDDEEDDGSDDEDEDDDDNDDDASDESQWERANGYRADGTIFEVHDVSSDDDEDVNGAERGNNNPNQPIRRNWMDGIRVLRSFANPRGHP